MFLFVESCLKCHLEQAFPVPTRVYPSKVFLEEVVQQNKHRMH